MDYRVVFKNLGLCCLDLGLLVQHLLLYLMDLVVDGKKSLLGQLHLVLSLGLWCVVLFSPSSQFSVHGLNVIIDELDWFSKRSCVLAYALDHVLDQLQFFVCQLASTTYYFLWGAITSLLLFVQFAQVDSLAFWLFSLNFLLSYHFFFGFFLKFFYFATVLIISCRFLRSAWFDFRRRKFLFFLSLDFGRRSWLLSFFWLFKSGSRWRPLRFLNLLFLRLSFLAKNPINIRLRWFPRSSTFVKFLKHKVGQLHCITCTSGSSPATIFWGLA